MCFSQKLASCQHHIRQGIIIDSAENSAITVCLYLVKTSLNVFLKNPFLSPNIVIKYQHHSYSYSEPACSSIRGVIDGGPKECIYLG